MNNLIAKPTPKQAAAGNYKKGHMRLHGLDITIETPRGRSRKPGWPKMPCHYGYLRRTEGADGDHVDAMIGGNLKSELVVIVDQLDRDGRFDECKVILGCQTKAQAISLYKKSYAKNWKLGPVTVMTIEQFKNWLKYGDQKNPTHQQVSRYQAGEAWEAVLAGISGLVADERKVPQPEKQAVYPLRTARDRSLSAMDEQLRGILQGYGATPERPEIYAGAQGQQSWVRAEQLHMGTVQSAIEEQKEQYSIRAQRPVFDSKRLGGSVRDTICGAEKQGQDLRLGYFQGNTNASGGAEKNQQNAFVQRPNDAALSMGRRTGHQPHYAGKSTANRVVGRENVIDTGAKVGDQSQADHYESGNNSHRWITTETGSHILIDSQGTVKAGADGKLDGKKLSSAKSETPEAKPNRPRSIPKKTMQHPGGGIGIDLEGRIPVPQTQSEKEVVDSSRQVARKSPAVRDFASSIMERIKQAEQAGPEADQPSAKDHPLHHSQLSPEHERALLAINGHLHKLVGQVNAMARITANAGGDANAQREAKKRAWEGYEQEITHAPDIARLREQLKLPKSVNKFDGVDQSQVKEALGSLTKLINDAGSKGTDLSPYVRFNNIIPRELAAKLKPNDSLFRPVSDNERFAIALADVISEHYAARRHNTQPGQLGMFGDGLGGDMLRSTKVQQRFDWDESKVKRDPDGKFAEKDSHKESRDYWNQFKKQGELLDSPIDQPKLPVTKDDSKPLHEKTRQEAIGDEEKPVHESVAELLATLDAATLNEASKRMSKGSRYLDLSELPISKKAANELKKRGLAIMQSGITAPRFGNGLQIVEPGKKFDYIALTDKGRRELQKYNKAKEHEDALTKAIEQGKAVATNVLKSSPKHMTMAIENYVPDKSAKPTYGDLVEAPDGRRGVMHGSHGIGSDRREVRNPDNPKDAQWYSIGELQKLAPKQGSRITRLTKDNVASMISNASTANAAKKTAERIAKQRPDLQKEVMDALFDYLQDVFSEKYTTSIHNLIVEHYAANFDESKHPRDDKGRFTVGSFAPHKQLNSLGRGYKEIHDRFKAQKESRRQKIEADYDRLRTEAESQFVEFRDEAEAAAQQKIEAIESGLANRIKQIESQYGDIDKQTESQFASMQDDIARAENSARAVKEKIQDETASIIENAEKQLDKKLDKLESQFDKLRDRMDEREESDDEKLEEKINALVERVADAQAEEIEALGKFYDKLYSELDEDAEDFEEQDDALFTQQQATEKQIEEFYERLQRNLTDWGGKYADQYAAKGQGLASPSSMHDLIVEHYAAKKPQKGQQEFQWITVHPNSGPGRPVMIDKDGTIQAGMGGKFNGQKIDEAGKGGAGESDSGKGEAKSKGKQVNAETEKAIAGLRKIAERTQKRPANNYDVDQSFKYRKVLFDNGWSSDDIEKEQEGDKYKDRLDDLKERRDPEGISEQPIDKAMRRDKPSSSTSEYIPPTVPGEQTSLFGGDDMNTGQKSLFNVARPSKADQRAAKRQGEPMPVSLLEQIDDEQKKLADDRKSLPGQKSLLDDTSEVSPNTALKKQGAIEKMSPSELSSHINNQSSQSPFSESRVEDWGTMRGQGKRRGGMVMGAMSGAPRGKKTYVDLFAKLPKSESVEANMLEKHRQVDYLKARNAGLDHEHAMTWTYEKDGDVEPGFTHAKLKESNMPERFAVSHAMHQWIVDHYRAGSMATPKSKAGENPHGKKGDKATATIGTFGDKGKFVTIDGRVVFIESKESVAAKRKKRDDAKAPYQPKNALDRAIVDYIGNHKKMVEGFKPFIEDAYKMVNRESSDRSNAIKSVLGAFGHTGKKAYAFVEKLRKQSDYDKVPGFDEMAEYAKRYHPELLTSTSGSMYGEGNFEQAVFDGLKEGFDRRYPKDSPEVLEMAAQMAGSDFFDEANWPDDSQEVEGVPFSATLDLHSLIIEHYCAVNA